MKNLTILLFAFFALSSAYAQTYRESKSNSIQLTTQILPTKDSKNVTGIFLYEGVGKIHAIDTLDFRSLPTGDFVPEEKIYTMPIMEPESECPMPIHIPNPEIHHTIQDKRLEGIVINPRKK